MATPHLPSTARNGCAGMILVVDMVSERQAHVPFNHAYLQVLRHAFPASPIRFLGELAHCDALAELEPSDGRVTFGIGPFHGKVSPAATRPLAALRRAISVIRAARTIAESLRAEFVAILGVYPAMIWAVRRYWTDARAPPLHVIIHQGLNEIGGWRSRNPLVRHFDARSQFGGRVGGKVRFVVLEQHIAANLIAACPARKIDTLVLEHPVPQTEIADREIIPADPLRIGFIGDTSAGKGFPAFLALARTRREFSFHAFGKAVSPLPDDAGQILDSLPGTPMPRAEYLARLRALDLVALPFTGSTYDWTASGSLIDCITQLIPVVTTRTALTASCFERFGPIGLLIDDPADLSAAVAGIDADWLKARLPQFGGNLRKARDARLPQVLGQRYRRSLNAGSA